MAVKRDADALIRSKIPSIRSYNVDKTLTSPTESEPTSLYTTISSATTTTIAKAWPKEIKSISIANTAASVITKLDIYIYDTSTEATSGYIIKGMKLDVGATLVLGPEDIFVPDDDEIKIVTAAWTSGTPSVSVIINY